MSFDPDSFVNMTLTEANDTKLVPVPAGEYTGIVKEYKARQWKKKDDPSIVGYALDLTWTVEDEGVKEFTGRDVVTVKQGIMLDMNESGTGLDMGKGKNVGLGRLREALNLNEPGQPFSFSMMVGRPAKIVVKHRNGETPDVIYAEVNAVAKMG